MKECRVRAGKVEVLQVSCDCRLVYRNMYVEQEN